jgi:hypothetical protein
LIGKLDYEQLTVPIVVLLELYRRFQWGVFRLEFEHLKNSEGYRSVAQVPMFFDHRDADTRNNRTDRTNSILEVTLMIVVLVVIAVLAAFA